MNSKSVLILLFTLLSITLYGCSMQEKAPELRGAYLDQTPPDTIPEIFAPGIVSHGFHELGITFSPDGNELLYIMTDKNYSHYAIVSMKNEDGVWRAPEILPFSGEHKDISVAFSHDGKRLYFTSNRPVPTDTTLKKHNIWYVESTDQGWSEPMTLGAPINTSGIEGIGSIAANGNMYIQADYDQARQFDIYLSRLENGQYLPPENLAEINSQGVEGHPAIAPDESYILFYSNRLSGTYNNDIFVSFRNDDGSWSSPIVLSNDVNSSVSEFDPCLSPDGKYIFFSTYRPIDPKLFKGKSYNEYIELYRMPENGYATLYWIDAKIIEKFRPEK
jgi:Tol biopolymer transport system component